MSALAEAEDLASKVDFGALRIGIREGDWKSYLEHVGKCSENKDLIRCYGSVIEYKRQCAMLYLGKRAQFHGGVCSRTQPRVLTSQLVAELSDTNKVQRYKRYPWLETLLNLLAEIERIQDEATGGDGNIISLVPAAK